MTSILDSLPTLYRGIFPSFFQSPIPPETKATCSACAMCESANPIRIDSVDGVNRFFRPDTKCCTYHPRLPNYLVGAILSDEDAGMAEGRRRIQEKIARGVSVNPQWIKAPTRYNLLYMNARQAFGRSESLRCPYYEPNGGLCTIWRYREAVCSTYFCKYVAGADGRKFWMTLKTWLTLAEIQLSRYALLQLLPDYVLLGKDKADNQSGPLTVEDLDDQRLPEKDYAELWHPWVGREEEFYRRSYEVVRALSSDEFENLLGIDGIIELSVLKRLHGNAVTASLPKTLKLNPSATIQWLPDGSVAMASYSEFDAVALPGAAYSLLVEFTGKEPVETVRQRLRTEKQADLHDDILVELFRHRILIDAAKPQQ
jgi:Fe-S-cluster containining protein